MGNPGFSNQAFTVIGNGIQVDSVGVGSLYFNYNLWPRGLLPNTIKIYSVSFPPVESILNDCNPTVVLIHSQHLVEHDPLQLNDDDRQ